jgi:hypothetical protein
MTGKHQINFTDPAQFKIRLNKGFTKNTSLSLRPVDQNINIKIETID